MMPTNIENQSLNGVMLNAYPDSIGQKLSDAIKILQHPQFQDAFSFFYILPTFFNSDLDRGFSVIDYNLNKELVSTDDLKALEKLNIQLKFDIVLNHLSIASPQFKDLLEHGNASEYKDFFINWNSFWKGHGTLNNEGVIIPKKEFLDKLFMRKSGLPILKVPFPDGTIQPYWNTFYQQIVYQHITLNDLVSINELSSSERNNIVNNVNTAITQNKSIDDLDFKIDQAIAKKVMRVIYSKCTFFGQMDVNAKSPLVWEFYEETLAKLKDFGCKILRLDAFAYLHKEVGQSNFFNKPGTWEYLERIKAIAQKNNLILLPEIHAEYGLGLHDQVAQKGYYIYDFFLPGLVIHTLETSSKKALITWMNEIISKGYKTINMLGCHDGIPVLDLKGKEVNNTYNQGLLRDAQIELIMQTVLERGGLVKNLYGPSGEKIAYYQINATFFSALGVDEQKLLLARAIQLFMPGIPQIWYLDIFAGTNNYKAVENAGSAGHKEINRTTLSVAEIEKALQTDIVTKQLMLIKFRNTSKAFLGNMTINECLDAELDITWSHHNDYARLQANLKSFKFTITHKNKADSNKTVWVF